MITQTTPRWLRALIGLLAVVLPLAGSAQNLTQADFAGVVVPQYASSGTATRLPVVFRATVSNLTPSMLYRYYNQAGISTDLGTANSGAGNPLLANIGATPAATTYVYTSTASLTTAASYATFTTNASGSYTGWFAYLNTGNARFTPGNTLYMTIVLAPDATPTVVEKRLALDQTLTVLALGTGTTATDASGFKGNSAATAKNMVAVYDNVAGTGRPLSVALVEAIAATGATVGSLPAYYTTAAGDWNTLIPNVLPNGVRRVEQRSVVDGAVVGCASDADGVWPSTANTVNPVVGLTAVALTATDAPLNTSACNSATTATITATPASLTAFSTPVGTASASQTITVGGTTLTAGIVVTAPAGYQVSLVAASGYAASVTVPQTGGTAVSTPVYVRLAGATVGAYAGNVTVASTGATAVNVAVTGTVTSTATPVPTITSFTPISGPVGTTITVTGTNFTGATAGIINGLAGTNFMVMSATSVMFDVPTGATSGVITVTTPGGTATSTGTFTVTAPVVVPTITSITPNAQVVGGPAVTITIAGTGFTPASTVNFNSVSYTQTSSTATSLVVTVPASAVATVGNYPVTVTNTAGTSNVNTFTVSNPSTAGAFEDFETGTKTGYGVAPVTLGSGVWTFSDALIGTGFSDRFNGLKSARIRVGFIAMNFDKPTGAGTVTVNAGLYGIDTGATFILEKSTDGGTTYTTVPGAPATLTATLTPYTFVVNQAGNVRFRVSSTNTTTVRISIDDISISNYTAPAAPVITSITPTTAVAGNAATTITITGTGFVSNSIANVSGLVTFTGLPVTFVSATQLTISVPAYAPAGSYSLNVVNNPGATGASASNSVAFTLTAAPNAPTITSFTPVIGSAGAVVTVTGTNFTGATAVQLRSTISGALVNVTPFAVVSATSITFTMPVTPSSVRILVTTPNGTAASPGIFNVITAMLPSQALPGLTVFPNPATDRITVALPAAGAATVALRDLTGRLVLAPAALAADKQLYLPAGLAAGVYLLEVRQGGVTAVRRIEKN